MMMAEENKEESSFRYYQIDPILLQLKIKNFKKNSVYLAIWETFELSTLYCELSYFG